MTLRIVDLGWVPGVRSQTAWHAIAETMRPGDPAVLALMSPLDAYVSLGYHRSTDELDLDACARLGLRIYRRRAGGGPVLCDPEQLFFQLIAPAASMPAVMERAWTRALGPAVDAFRAMGAPAMLAEGNDLVASGRKISGTGAARIGEAVVFVGNVLFGFDHRAMAGCLRLPEDAREEAARLMSEHLATIEAAAGRPVSREAAQRALVEAYAAAFGGAAAPGPLDDAEEQAARRLDGLLGSPDWVGAPRRPMPPRVKIRAGVAVLVLAGGCVSVVDGVIERVRPAASMPPDVAERLTGLPLDEAGLRETLAGWPGGDAFVRDVLDAYRGGIV